MKDQIMDKIEEIVKFIIDKNAEEITLDDYTILTNELREIRNREAQADNGKRMAELMAMVASPVGSTGN